jgi:carbonic anhydrase/acetyltransferase-like protein (isoleucine patch superfamily)
MIRPFIDAYPVFDETNFIAPSAEVIGDVTLGPQASIWFNTTVRGDVNWIRIGARSNVQDNTVIHVTNRVAPTEIGAGVTIGHSAVVHGCTVEDDVLVGMGAVILDHAVIGHDSIIGAKALVTARTVIPPRSMVLGAPARVVRPLTDDEVASIRVYADHYIAYSRIYLGLDVPTRNPFYERAPARERAAP